MTEIRRLSAVFIHGLGASAESTWAGNPTLPDVADQLPNVTASHYKYVTKKFRLNPLAARPAAIQSLADGLRSHLELRLPADDSKFLVCHSLGGLVAKWLLLDDAKAGRESGIVGALLFGTPNNGSDLARLAKHFGLRNAPVRQLAKDSDFLRILNTEWERMDMKRKVHVHYVVGLRDTAVDEESARATWGNSQVTIDPEADHGGLVRPLSAQAISVHRLIAELTAAGERKRDMARVRSSVFSNFPSPALDSHLASPESTPRSEVAFSIASLKIRVHGGGRRRHCDIDEQYVGTNLASHPLAGLPISVDGDLFEDSEALQYQSWCRRPGTEPVKTRVRVLRDGAYRKIVELPIVYPPVGEGEDFTVGIRYRFEYLVNASSDYWFFDPSLKARHGTERIKIHMVWEGPELEALHYFTIPRGEGAATTGDALHHGQIMLTRSHTENGPIVQGMLDIESPNDNLVHVVTTTAHLT